MPAFLERAQANTARMVQVFTHPDPLLGQVGMVILYYHLFRLAEHEDWDGEITRKRLADFDKVREANRKKAEQSLATADYDLIEFDRYAQSPNDAYAIRLRLRILLREVFGRDVATDNL